MTHEELTYEGLQPAKVETPSCPKCGSHETIKYRTWLLKSPKGNVTRMGMWCCQKCGKKFRKGEKIPKG